MRDESYPPRPMRNSDKAKPPRNNGAKAVGPDHQSCVQFRCFSVGERRHSSHGSFGVSDDIRNPHFFANLRA
jgi:hypothetical protein